MDNNFLRGITTALITPFKNGKIDYAKLEQLLNEQANAEISAILLFGTTGEPYSLSFSEKRAIMLFVKRIIPNIPIIVGVSHPSTQECINECKRFSSLGASAIMVTTPYFYKTLDKGILAHFTQIAYSTTLPIIIYNVPTRTNCDISSKTTLLNDLSKIKNIVAIKQASPDLNLCKNLLKHTNKLLLCGNDLFTLELLQQGYHGAISVLSNALPKEFVKIYHAVNNKDFTTATNTFNKIYPLINTLEKTPNPIGIKYLCSQIYKSANELRLPLVELNKSQTKEIDNCLNNFLGE